MGLDMTFYKQPSATDTSTYPEWGDVDYPSLEVLYLRKANHIREWLSNNCINFIDNEGGYLSSQLVDKFLADAKTVLTGDTSVLPTSEGFFFGSTNYDDYYYQTITETIEAFSAWRFTNPPDSYIYYSESY